MSPSTLQMEGKWNVETEGASPSQGFSLLRACLMPWHRDIACYWKQSDQYEAHNPFAERLSHQHGMAHRFMLRFLQRSPDYQSVQGHWDGFQGRECNSPFLEKRKPSMGLSFKPSLRQRAELPPTLFRQWNVGTLHKMWITQQGKSLVLNNLLESVRQWISVQTPLKNRAN